MDDRMIRTRFQRKETINSCDAPPRVIKVAKLLETCKMMTLEPAMIVIAHQIYEVQGLCQNGYVVGLQNTSHEIYAVQVQPCKSTIKRLCQEAFFLYTSDF
jgi:hypothetical protein